MRKLILSCCIILINIISFGQGADTVRNRLLNETLFKGSYFSFSVTPYISHKAKILRQSGEYAPGSTNMHGIEAGGNYFINFNKNYSLIMGLHGGASARNYVLHISKNDFIPQLDRDVDEQKGLTRTYDFYLSAPIWFEKRWTSKNNNHWNLTAGINVRFYPSDIEEINKIYYSDINSQPVLVYYQDVVIGDIKTWINYNIGGGYAFLLKNYNFLQINLLANFSCTKMVNGDYALNVTGRNPSTGKYSADLSYAGLSFSYIFTGTNKRMRKIYEHKLGYH